jgi:hypothetical protein
MSNQILISSGAKLRDLDDVIIGTDGILSSLGFNVANGVPKLDENGKILVSQLPNSVMEFKGVWNAATNTPTLANGTGNAGDVWLCNVAGTVNFGAGPIAFAVGDYAVYTGTVWARSSGATGTVTSVGLSRDGDALSVTGSPITTSGTINLGFSGNNTQYINGAGNLTTFPTIITSIGLTMPAAFNVSNSPLTSNGTIGVTAAGYPSQYIRGDGTLADFPTSGGGGSSVSYYLNGGTSQGTIGGTTYYEMSKTANTGTGVDFSKSGDGLITSFLTDAGDPALLQIPAGNWNLEIYASMSSNGGTPEIYAELYKYNGTTFTLVSTSTNEILYDGVNLNLYTFAMAVPETVLTVTDRLAIKLYAINSGGKTTTIHTQNGHLCQVITTFTTGLTALNGLTAQVQYFGTGTSGSDFNIVSSVDTHTFNLPTASATKRGALSSADWSTFNGKQAGSTNLTSLAALTYASTSFVKMTAAGTFALDTNTYALASALGDYLPLTGGTLTGELAIKTNTSTGLNILSSTGTQGLWVRAGYDTDGTATPIVSANNIQFQSSGTVAGSFSFVVGNTKALFIANNAAATFFNTISATNFSGSSSGTNTGDQDLSGYLLKTGGTLTGALIGTTAAFNGFGIGTTPSSKGIEATYIRYLNTGGDFYIGIENSTSTFFNATAYANVMYMGSTNFEMFFSGAKRLTITNGGAATFVGAITASNFSGSSSGTNTGDQTLAGLGGVGGTGTINTVPKFTAASTIASSNIYINGNFVGINQSSPAAPYALDVHAANSTYNLRLFQPLTATDSYNTIYITGNQTTVAAYFGIGGSTTGNTSFRDVAVIGTQSEHNLVFNTSDAKKMT